MPVYAVNSKEQPMTATGIVQAVTEWEGPKGNRRATDRQATDEKSGLPLASRGAGAERLTGGLAGTLIHCACTIPIAPIERKSLRVRITWII